MCFLCQAQPHEHLVKRGCFFGKPHPCASLKNLCFFSWFSPSANTNQHFSHYLISSSPCPFSLSRIATPPLWYSGETSDWQWETSWGRDARWEKPAPVLLSSQSLKGKSSPGTKRAPSFVQQSTWGLFLLCGAGPPLHSPTPVMPFPCMVLTPFIVFPLSLIYLWIPVRKDSQTAKKILQNDRRSVCTTLLKVRC